MTSSPRMLTLPTVVLSVALALSACSGDDDTPDPAPSSDGASGDSQAPTGKAGQPEGADKPSRGCTADVTVTGAAQAAWKADADVRRPQSEGAAVTAVYDTTSKAGSLNAVAGAGDNPDVATVSLGKQNYSTLGQDGTVEVSPKGTQATIESDAVSPQGRTVQLEATFTCTGKKASKDKKSRDTSKQ